MRLISGGSGREKIFYDGALFLTLSSRPERHQAVVVIDALGRGVERSRHPWRRHAVPGNSPQTLRLENQQVHGSLGRTPRIGIAVDATSGSLHSSSVARLRRAPSSSVEMTVPRGCSLGFVRNPRHKIRTQKPVRGPFGKLTAGSEGPLFYHNASRNARGTNPGGLSCEH